MSLVGETVKILVGVNRGKYGYLFSEPVSAGGYYSIRVGGLRFLYEEGELEFQLQESTGDDINDPVNHPSHYTSHPKGIEALEVIEDNPFYNLAAAMKYIWRVSWGGKADDLEDLKKAEYYIHREIEKRSK